MDIVRTIVALQWAVDQLDWVQTDEERRNLKFVKQLRDHLMNSQNALTSGEREPTGTNVSAMRPFVPPGKEVIRR